uniref:Uncharacterized protein n=1 Tax=Oryza glaberrima TaxID=4538 RepID=I1NPK8_ORYGL
MNRKESWGRLTPPPPLPMLVTFNIDTNTLTDRHSILLWIKTVLLLGNWSIIPDSSCLNASKTSGSNLKPLLFEVNKFREQ